MRPLINFGVTLTKYPFRSWRYFLFTLLMLFLMATTSFVIIEKIEPGMSKWIIERIHCHEDVE